ncbi:MAG: hypothetical protein Q9206_003654 [Seirophora lacunosa]
MINGPDGPEPDPSRPVLCRVRLGVGERVPFDFEYPPYTQKKIIIARGFLDDETREGYVSIWIFGHFLGDFYVDADKVFKFHVDLSLAQGYVSMFSEYCDPEARKDCVYFAVALDLPFRQHLKKQWLLFKIPHNDKVKQMDNPATTG